jgi:hypothetical protein
MREQEHLRGAMNWSKWKPEIAIQCRVSSSPATTPFFFSFPSRPPGLARSPSLAAAALSSEVLNTPTYKHRGIMYMKKISRHIEISAHV